MATETKNGDDIRMHRWSSYESDSRLWHFIVLNIYVCLDIYMYKDREREIERERERRRERYREREREREI